MMGEKFRAEDADATNVNEEAPTESTDFHADARGPAEFLNRRPPTAHPDEESGSFDTTLAL